MDIREKINFKENVPIRVDIYSINHYPAHWHKDVTEIVIPLKGTVKIVSNFEKFTITEGDYTFINHSCIHEITSADKNAEAIVALLYVDLNYFEEQFEYIKNMFFRTKPYQESDNAQLELEDEIIKEYKTRFRNLLISIISDFMGNETQHDIISEKYEQQFIYALVYEFDWLQFINTNKSFISSIHLNRYHRIVQYIDEHFSEKITLNDIAKREFITKNYLSHFWKNISSFSFQERVNYERVMKSLFLLIKDETITDISDICGFSDVKYYYSNFKKWFKCMPLEYKEKLINSVEKKKSVSLLTFNDINNVFYNYVNSNFSINCNYDNAPDISASVENYLKIQHLYTVEEQIKTQAPKYVQIYPFNKDNLRIIDDENIVFNWHNMDLWVNLTIDLDFEMYIVISNSYLESETFYDVLNYFLERCIDRYGIKIVKKWFFVNSFSDSTYFYKADKIEDIIYNKIKKPNIKYYFEF